MKAIFISRWVFSMIFADSATFIELALCTPASIISSYTFAIFSADSASHPLVTFTILVRVWSLSPGFILSGENPTLKSVPHFNPENLSSTGTQSSSVQPGYTVDS